MIESPKLVSFDTFHISWVPFKSSPRRLGQEPATGFNFNPIFTKNNRNSNLQ